MSKISRTFMEFVYAAIGANRAEDIPYDASNSIKAKIDAIESGNVPGLVPGNRPDQWGYLSAVTGGGSSMVGMGTMSQAVFTDVTSFPTSSGALSGIMFQQSGSPARLTDAGTGTFLGNNLVLIGKVRSAAATDDWAFGFNSGLNDQPTQNNDWAGSYAMLQYRSGRDTNFQLATKDNVTQKLVDTGIAPAANTEYYFVVDVDLSNTLVTLTIYDANYVQLASVTTATNLPLNSGHTYIHERAAFCMTFFMHMYTRPTA